MCSASRAHRRDHRDCSFWCIIYRFARFEGKRGKFLIVKRGTVLKGTRVGSIGYWFTKKCRIAGLTCCDVKDCVILYVLLDNHTYSFKLAL